MADGNPIADMINRLTVPQSPRFKTSDECFDDFAGEATERTTATVSELVGDRRTLQQMARVVADCMSALEPLHEKLGEARAIRKPYGTTYGHMVDHDEYAVVEALFNEILSPAAERLLKAEVREELRARKAVRG